MTTCTLIISDATGHESNRGTCDVRPTSPVGQLFADPTVDMVIVIRNPDGAILKGNKTTTYLRQKE